VTFDIKYSHLADLRNLTPSLYRINKTFPKLEKIDFSIEVTFGVGNWRRSQFAAILNTVLCLWGALCQFNVWRWINRELCTRMQPVWKSALKVADYECFKCLAQSSFVIINILHTCINHENSCFPSRKIVVRLSAVYVVIG
jgi:hypothetical protein